MHSIEGQLNWFDTQVPIVTLSCGLSCLHCGYLVNYRSDLNLVPLVASADLIMSFVMLHV